MPTAPADDVDKTRTQTDADRIKTEADEQAKRIIAQADEQAKRITSDAEERARRIIADAEERARTQTQEADAIKNRAQADADAIRNAAQTEADSIKSGANAEAERIRNSAQAAPVQEPDTARRAAAATIPEPDALRAVPEQRPVPVTPIPEPDALRAVPEQRPVAAQERVAPVAATTTEAPVAQRVSPAGAQAQPTTGSTGGAGRAALFGAGAGAVAGTPGGTAATGAAAGAGLAVAIGGIDSIIARRFANVTMRNIPIVGSAVAGVSAISRVMAGDVRGATMDASSIGLDIARAFGIAAAATGVGAAVAAGATTTQMGLTIATLTRDVFNEVYEKAYGIPPYRDTEENVRVRSPEIQEKIATSITNFLRSQQPADSPEVIQQEQQQRQSLGIDEPFENANVEKAVRELQAARRNQQANPTLPRLQRVVDNRQRDLSSLLQSRRERISDPDRERAQSFLDGREIATPTATPVPATPATPVPATPVPVSNQLPTTANAAQPTVPPTDITNIQPAAPAPTVAQAPLPTVTAPDAQPVASSVQTASTILTPTTDVAITQPAIPQVLPTAAPVVEQPATPVSAPRISAGTQPRITAATEPTAVSSVAQRASTPTQQAIHAAAPAAVQVVQQNENENRGIAERIVDSSLQQADFFNGQYTRVEEFREELIQAAMKMREEDSRRPGGGMESIRINRITQMIRQEQNRQIDQGHTAEHRIPNQQHGIPVQPDQPGAESPAVPATAQMGRGASSNLSDIEGAPTEQAKMQAPAPVNSVQRARPSATPQPKSTGAQDLLTNLSGSYDRTATRDGDHHDHTDDSESMSKDPVTTAAQSAVSIQSLLSMLSGTEFNEIKIEAEKIEFDGRVSLSAAEASLVTPTAAPFRGHGDLMPEMSRQSTGAMSPMGSTGGVSQSPAAAPSQAGGASQVGGGPSEGTGSMSSATGSGSTGGGGGGGGSASPVSASPASPAVSGGSQRTGSSDQGSISQIIQAGPGFNVVQYDDGRIERRTGSRNWRNNNPGNLEFGDFSRRYGALGTDGRFAIFPTYEAGLRAKEALLFEGRGYAGMTIAQAITRYAPPNENDTAVYIRTVSAAVGASPTTLMSDLNPDQRKALLASMERVEGFRVGKVDVVQPGTAVAAAAGAPPATGAGLASESAGMAAADQAQARGAGRQVVVQMPPSSVSEQQRLAPTAAAAGASRGEVSLNRRLEKQVA